MSVFKVEKQKDYTVMSNYHLRDKDLSYKAKGLLSFMLSLPEDWNYSLARTPFLIVSPLSSVMSLSSYSISK